MDDGCANGQLRLRACSVSLSVMVLNKNLKMIKKCSSSHLRWASISFFTTYSLASLANFSNKFHAWAKTEAFKRHSEIYWNFSSTYYMEYFITNQNSRAINLIEVVTLTSLIRTLAVLYIIMWKMSCKHPRMF